MPDTITMPAFVVSTTKWAGGPQYVSEGGQLNLNFTTGTSGDIDFNHNITAPTTIVNDGMKFPESGFFIFPSDCTQSVELVSIDVDNTRTEVTAKFEAVVVTDTNQTLTKEFTALIGYDKSLNVQSEQNPHVWYQSFDMGRSWTAYNVSAAGNTYSVPFPTVIHDRDS